MMKTKPTSSRRRFLLLLLLFVFFVVNTSIGIAQDNKPISKNGLLESLRIDGLSPDELVTIIQRRGVGFFITPKIEEELRLAGATNKVLLAVRINHRPPKATKRSSSSDPFIEQQIKIAQQKLNRQPHSAQGHFELGETYRKWSRYEEAVAAYKKAVRLQPQFAEAYFGIGESFRRLSSFTIGVQRLPLRTQYAETAIAAYKQSLRLKPENAQAHYGLGLSYGLVWPIRTDEAIEALLLAVELNPNFADAYFELGLVSSRVAVVKYESGEDAKIIKEQYGEHLELAINAFKKVISIEPSYYHVYLRLGDALAASARFDEAIDSYKQAIIVDRSDGQSYINLCTVYITTKRLFTGVVTFEELIQEKPTESTPHYCLGILHLHSGDKSAALAEYRILKNMKDETLASWLFDEIYK